MASQVLMSVSAVHTNRDENERARLESEFKYKMDMQSNLVTAKREGQEEEQKKLLDNARNALAKGYPIETIHDITGLDIESIKALL